MSATVAARRLVELKPGHPVISLYLDLDPERFAAPAARAAQIRSLLDEARREIEDREFAHDDRQGLRDDLDRIDRFLAGDDAPFHGARGLAIFCSLRDGLFEVVQLARPLEPRVLIAPTPFVEPLVRGAHDRRWCVALVSRRSARVLSGLADRLEERQRIEDNVHDEPEADDHLRRVAEMLLRRWRREGFDRLALGGPIEAVSRLEMMLHGELRGLLCERRVEVDVATATEDSVRAALARLAEEDERARERAALGRLADALARGTGAAAGVQATLAALGERRVGTLLLEPSFTRDGARCPECGMLLVEARTACPVDGTLAAPVERVSEAVVEAALAQDAEIIFVRHGTDLGAHEGIAALLRF